MVTPALADAEFGDRNRGEILLAGLVTAPGRSPQAGFPAGVMPLEGVQVKLEGTRHTAVTDQRGQFVFTERLEGEFTVVMSRPGYQTVTRRVRLSAGASTPATLSVEMVPEGTRLDQDTPVGLGTLYVAYARKPEADIGHGEGGLFNLMKAMAVGWTPLDQPPPNPEINTPPDLHTASNFVMMRPEASPGRTGYHNLEVPVLWPHLEASGRFLYLSTVDRRILVLDTESGNDLVAQPPVQNLGLVTSMANTEDGSQVAATVMASPCGIMMIDARTHTPESYLTVDGTNLMIPTAVAAAPDGGRLFVTFSNGLDRNAPGRLFAIDRTTGETLGELQVGSSPTDIALGPDGKTGFVANSAGGTLQVVDLESMTSRAVVTVGAEPLKVAVAADRVLVTNRRSDTVTAVTFEGVPIGRPIRVGDSPVDIAVSGGLAYVSNVGDGTLSILDIARACVIRTTRAMPRAVPFGLTVRL